MEEDTRKRYGDMYADGCMDPTSSPVCWWCLGTALCAPVTCPHHHRPVVPWSRGPHLAAAVSVTQRARGETLAPAQPPETRADRQLAGRQGHGGHFAPPDSGALGGKQTSPSPQTWTVKHQIDRRRKRQEYLHNYSGSYKSKSDTLLYPDSWS